MYLIQFPHELTVIKHIYWKAELRPEQFETRTHFQRTCLTKQHIVPQSKETQQNQRKEKLKSISLGKVPKPFLRLGTVMNLQTNSQTRW